MSRVETTTLTKVSIETITFGTLTDDDTRYLYNIEEKEGERLTVSQQESIYLGVIHLAISSGNTKNINKLITQYYNAGMCPNLDTIFRMGCQYGNQETIKFLISLLYADGESFQLFSIQEIRNLLRGNTNRVTLFDEFQPTDVLTADPFFTGIFSKEQIQLHIPCGPYDPDDFTTIDWPIPIKAYHSNMSFEEIVTCDYDMPEDVMKRILDCAKTCQRK